MITQNPIIGSAKRKIGHVYARTMYGKNILQTCPPPTKGHQTANQVNTGKAFGRLSLLSNQVNASLLNSIYYNAPTNHSRRAEWLHQLAAGYYKEQNEWQYDPSRITALGSNKVVTKAIFPMTPPALYFSMEKSFFNKTTNAVDSRIPCVILICPETNQCISLLPWTSLDGDYIVFNNLSPTFLGKQCYLFPLWQCNVGTLLNPIYAYGSFNIN